ncbi:MAG TPA: hypothetical protein VFW87_13125 [Pirellulales bacterium]|nr:hypothetical protein [Pirellulales bacterium]
MAEITRRVTQWRGSFVNLRVVWELRSLPETDDAVVDWPAPPSPAEGRLFSRMEWIWADHGLDFLEDWSFFYEDGTSRIHSIEAFNGPKGVVFRALYRKSPNEPEEFKALHLDGLGIGKPTSPKVRAPVEALYWPGDAAWLPEMLSKWTWTLGEFESVGGEPCARIEATPPGADANFTEIVWLDLEHDCLVRRYRRPSLPGIRVGGDFIVDEFQQLEDGIWFPKRGRLQLGGTPHENHLFVVTEAAVNRALDLARFDPPAPVVGTVVDDHGRAYRHGVSSASVAQPAPASLDARQARARALSAAPPTRGWFWSAFLATISIMFLAIGLWFSHRTQGSRS